MGSLLRSASVLMVSAASLPSEVHAQWTGTLDTRESYGLETVRNGSQDLLQGHLMQSLKLCTAQGQDTVHPSFYELGHTWSEC